MVETLAAMHVVLRTVWFGVLIDEMREMVVETLAAMRVTNCMSCFLVDEMREMLVKAGLAEQSNLIDRRLQVNRGRQLKMYRVWIQCKYQKPL